VHGVVACGAAILRLRGGRLNIATATAKNRKKDCLSGQLDFRHLAAAEPPHDRGAKTNANPWSAGLPGGVFTTGDLRGKPLPVVGQSTGGAVV